MWWPLQRQIADFAHVVSYDRAGYLWSDPPARRQSIDDRVDDLHALLQRSVVRNLTCFVAHSYGGLLSRRFAKRWPEEVAGLVLVDAPPESVLFKPSFLAYCAKGATFQRSWRQQPGRTVAPVRALVAHAIAANDPCKGAMSFAWVS